MKKYTESSEIPKWYEFMNHPDYLNKLIYKVDKTIPPVVQQVLE